MNRNQRRVAKKQGEASSQGASPEVLRLYGAALAHHQAGCLAEAEAGYAQALKADPRHADSLHSVGLVYYQIGRADLAAQAMTAAIDIDPNVAPYHANLGVALEAQGKPDEAAARYERALRLNPAYAEAHVNLAAVLQGRGETDKAVSHYERALGIRPNDAQTHHNLGLARRDQGRLGDAIARYRRAIALQPTFPEAYNDLGGALLAQGKPAEAVAAFQQALVFDPILVQAHYNLATALQALGRLDEAAARYERVLSLRPDSPDVLVNLGNTLEAAGRSAEAADRYGQALALKHDHPEALNNLSAVLRAMGRFDEAVEMGRRAIAARPGYADAHNNLGGALQAAGRFDEAVAEYRQALALRPDFAEGYNNLAIALQFQGDLVGARSAFDQAIALKTDYAEAHYNRADLKRFSADDPDLKVLRALAVAPLSARSAPYARYALGKALEDVGDHAGAFEQYTAGAALKRAQISYDEAAVEAAYQRIARTFDAGLLAGAAAGGDPSAAPIFVVGMPRSGSTLVEQILASHPRIQGGGELPDLAMVSGDLATLVPPVGDDARRMGEAYLARLPALGSGKDRITDKQLENFTRIGLIRLILPRAKIIHVRRDPADTCVSCYSKLFAGAQDFTYDLGELGRQYRRYDSLMAHWREVLPAGALHEVAYESVLDDLEGEARALIAYCGLDWDEACLSFHATRRPVATASAAQVRRPLYRDSLQRWRAYGSALEPLFAALGDLAPRR